MILDQNLLYGLSALLLREKGAFEVRCVEHLSDDVVNPVAWFVFVRKRLLEEIGAVLQTSAGVLVRLRGLSGVC